MLPFVIAAAACLAMSASGPDANPETDKTEIAGSASPDVIEIAAVADSWVKLYNTGDAKAVTELYAADGYYVSAHVLAHGKEAIFSYWNQGIKAGGHLDFVKPVEVYSEGNIGYYLGKYQATNAGTTVDGRITIVTKRFDGNWKIVVHETVVRDQPE